MRMVMRFSKLKRVSYLSHLDLQRFMQRTLRRSGLPVKYSGGFNPHIALSFACATKVGYTSEYEALDVKLIRPIDAYLAARAMTDALPKDMQVIEVVMIPDTLPSLMPITIASRYDITLIDQDMSAWAGAVNAYMAESSVMEMRKTKSGESLSDIRKMTREILIEGSTLRATLSLSEKSTLKPELLVESLSRRMGIVPPAISVHRRALLGENNTPIMELLK